MLQSKGNHWQSQHVSSIRSSSGFQIRNTTWSHLYSEIYVLSETRIIQHIQSMNPKSLTCFSYWIPPPPRYILTWWWRHMNCVSVCTRFHRHTAFTACLWMLKGNPSNSSWGVSVWTGGWFQWKVVKCVRKTTRCCQMMSPATLHINDVVI